MKKYALLILKIILLTQALFWFVLSIYNASVTGLNSLSQTVVTILMLLNAEAFAVLAYFLKYWKLPVKVLLLLFLLANTVLTFTDQVGVWDYITLALNLGALACFVLAVIPQGKKE